MTLPKFITNPDPEIYLRGKWVAIDFETTNNNKGDAVDERNYLVYWYYTSNFCGEGDSDQYKSLLDIEDKLYEADYIIAHNAKFELKWMRREGIKIERLLIYDTLLGEFVIAGNRKFPLDLDSTSRRYGGLGKASLVSKLIDSGVCPSAIPRMVLGSYCRQDVRETVRVHNLQRRVLYENGLLSVFFVRCLTTPVLADIESNGIFLDKELVRGTYHEALAERSRLVMELNQLTGGINMASPAQVAEFIYGKLGFKELVDKKGQPIRGKPNKKFPLGQPLTDEPTMEALVARTPEQKTFKELKSRESKLRKKITSYLERDMAVCGFPYQSLSDKDRSYPDVVGSCILHGTLNQTIAQTHRLTSSNPNLQNIDRTLKRLATARRKNWKIRSADYKTLEFTAAGILTGDPQILEDVTSNYDVHSFTASIVFKKEWAAAGSTRKSKAGDEVRTDAKPHTFKPLYGGMSGTKDEVAYYKAFREKYHICYKTQTDWTYQVLEKKKLRVASGLIFYWPDTQMSSSGYIKNTQAIFNYPIQSFATADLAPTGVCLLWHHMKSAGLNSFIINEVHDSVVIEEDSNESYVVGNLVEYAMSKHVVEFLQTVYRMRIDFPVTVEQKVSSHWDWEKNDKRN